MAKYKIRRFNRLDARIKDWNALQQRVSAKYRAGYRRPGSMNRKK